MGAACCNTNERNYDQELTKDPLDDETLSEEYKSKVIANLAKISEKRIENSTYKEIQKGQVKSFYIESQGISQIWKYFSDQMPNSFASTGTNSEIDSFIDLLENEEVRYVRKGYGLLTASLMTYSYMFLLPGALKPLYSYLPYDSILLMYTFGTFLLHTSTLLISNLIMYLIYHSKFEFFERYRISSDPWPWEKDPESFKKQLKRTLFTLSLNNLVLMPLFSLLPVLAGLCEINTSPIFYPEPFEVVWQVIFFMVVEDCVFYWTHRLLHTPFFYKRIHKQHHEYSTSIGLAAEYAHPIEFVFGNMLPTGLGATLLGGRCHIMTWYLWIFFRILETTDGHCGYEFSWSPFRLLPLSGSANYHNFHHSSNVGNFGSFFTYWDTLCQTNKHYWRYLAKSEKSA